MKMIYGVSIRMTYLEQLLRSECTTVNCWNSHIGFPSLDLLRLQPKWHLREGPAVQLCPVS